MVLAVEWGTGQVLWSVLWFTLFFLWFWLVISVFADIARARDLTGWAKAMWAVGILVLPLVGVVLYLIVNGDSMGRRDDDERRAAAAIRAEVRSGADLDAADELSRLARLHDSGRLNDEEYAQAKAKVVRG